MCKITAVSEKKSYYVCVKLKNVKVDIMPISNICKKMRCFLNKFTQLVRRSLDKF